MTSVEKLVAREQAAKRNRVNEYIMKGVLAVEMILTEVMDEFQPNLRSFNCSTTSPPVHFEKQWKEMGEEESWGVRRGAPKIGEDG